MATVAATEAAPAVVEPKEEVQEKEGDQASQQEQEKPQQDIQALVRGSVCTVQSKLNAVHTSGLLDMYGRIG